MKQPAIGTSQVRQFSICAIVILTAGLLVGETSAKTFDARSFGARGDGRAVDTEALQRALDACGQAGGGVVRLPAGTYLSRPIFLRSRTTLRLDKGATLQATDEPKDFRDPASPGAVLALVNGKGLEHVAITGQGKIDGAGARWWEPVRAAKRAGTPEPQRRPRLVVLTGCKHVRISGITLANSPSFHLVPVECEDVVIKRVTVKAPADSPNTDAIDPSVCRRVLITHCVLDVGDDNVALKSGRAVPGRTAACEDITVTRCTFLHGHGMSIGSETLGGVHRLSVRHCTFQDTVSGLRIKSARGRGGLVEDVTYSDITMKDVKIPLNITAYYPKVPAADTAQAVARDTPRYRRIRISNLSATSPSSAGLIVGLPEQPVEDLQLENVHLSAPQGLAVRNARGITFKKVTIQVQRGEPVRLENAEVRQN